MRLNDLAVLSEQNDETVSNGCSVIMCILYCTSSMASTKCACLQIEKKVHVKNFNKLLDL